MTPRLLQLVLWILTILPVIGLSQSHSGDSLNLVYQDSIAYQLYLSQPDSSIRIAQTTLKQALLIKNKYIEGFSYYILSKAYWAKGNYKLSAEFGFKSLKVFENTPHIKLWSKSLLALARTFIDLQNHPQGSDYIERAIVLSRSNNDQYSLAEAFREKSMLLSEQKKYDSALYYSDAGIKIFEAFNDSLCMSILFSRKAKIYFNQKNFELSSFYNRKALLYDSLVGNRRALGIAYYQSARDAVQLNDLDGAIVLLKKSIPINQEMHNVASLVKVHNLLADIYLKQEKSLQAVEQLQLASQYKDSLYNTEKSGQVQEMQSLYELSSKQRQIEMLERDNLFNHQQVKIQQLFVGFLLVCVILLGLMIFFLQRYRRLEEASNAELEKKNKSIEQQKEEIQSQAETLQDLNQLKNKLFSVISHDLRGPMANLHALLDLLTRKKLSAEEFISVSEKLKSSMDITQRTLENLLNWSLSQMEGIKTDPKTINIKHTITEACNLLDDVAQQKNVVIKNTIEDQMLVKADSDQLQLILRNLIHNAIKFSKPYDNISVSAYKDLEFCRVSVRDSGIGMTKTEIDTVVGSKHHFSKTGTMQEKGTGLGLLLCQEFIKLNGGEFVIKSNINNGTEVTFSLPLANN